MVTNKLFIRKAPTAQFLFTHQFSLQNSNLYILIRVGIRTANISEDFFNSNEFLEKN